MTDQNQSNYPVKSGRYCGSSGKLQKAASGLLERDGYRWCNRPKQPRAVGYRRRARRSPRGDNIAQRLHFPPLAVDYPATEHSARAARRTATAVSSGVEPSAILILPRGKICQPVQLRPPLENSKMARPGIKPDIHGIMLFAKRSAAAGRATISRRQDLRRFPDKPAVGALPGEEARDPLDDLRIDDRLTAVPAVENRDGHPPDPLPGDAPS